MVDVSSVCIEEGSYRQLLGNIHLLFGSALRVLLLGGWSSEEAAATLRETVTEAMYPGAEMCSDSASATLLAVVSNGSSTWSSSSSSSLSLLPSPSPPSSPDSEESGTLVMLSALQFNHMLEDGCIEEMEEMEWIEEMGADTIASSLCEVWCPNQWHSRCHSGGRSSSGEREEEEDDVVFAFPLPQQARSHTNDNTNTNNNSNNNETATDCNGSNDYETEELNQYCAPSFSRSRLLMDALDITLRQQTTRVTLK